MKRRKISVKQGEWKPTQPAVERYRDILVGSERAPEQVKKTVMLLGNLTERGFRRGVQTLIRRGDSDLADRYPELVPEEKKATA